MTHDEILSMLREKHREAMRQRLKEWREDFGELVAGDEKPHAVALAALLAMEGGDDN